MFDVLRECLDKSEPTKAAMSLKTKSTTILRRLKRRNVFLLQVRVLMGRATRMVCCCVPTLALHQKGCDSCCFNYVQSKKKQPEGQTAFFKVAKHKHRNGESLTSKNADQHDQFAAYSAVAAAASGAASTAAVLPKRLRNFSTRPPMVSTDFCVPV